MSQYKLGFSINLHDKDGDVFEQGILLHLNNGTIITFNTLDEYKDFINQMQSVIPEIEESL